MNQRGFGMIWDDPNPPPITREQWEAAQAACAANPVCVAADPGSVALVGAVFAAPAVEALALRGLVTLGPAAPAVMQRGAELAMGALVPGPPETRFGAVGFVLRTYLIDPVANFFSSR